MTDLHPQTPDFYKCQRCKHTGPADIVVSVDREPYGEGTVERKSEDKLCEKCGHHALNLVDGLTIQDPWKEETR